MRNLFLCTIATLALVTFGVCQQNASAAPAGGPTYTLTVIVDGVNEQGGNIGVLVFNSSKGWAEDRTAALKDITVPAHPGSVTIEIPGLPAGEYALSLVHDVNQNHKLDRNWMSKPTEQWGLSNDPHATVKTPSYSSARFTLKGDQTMHVKMQM